MLEQEVSSSTLWCGILGLQESYRGRDLEVSLESYGIQPNKVWGITSASVTLNNLVSNSERTKSKWTMRRPLIDGEFACYLGHIKMMRLFLDSNVEWALFLEDDAVVLHNPLLANDLLGQIKKASIIQLLNLDKSNNFTYHQNQLLNIEKRREPFFSTFGYLCNRSAAEIAIDIYSREGINSTIDWPPSWTSKIDFYSTNFTVVQHLNQDSQIGSRVGFGISERVRQLSFLLSSLIGIRLIVGCLIGIPLQIALKVEIKWFRYHLRRLSSQLRGIQALSFGEKKNA